MIGNLMGLYALLALIPFILIYLIRPKNFERVIPSLMFIMQEKNQFKKASFLQKLLRNLLFIIQLLVILFLALAVASPFLEIPHKVMVRNNILVLDASASMQTRDRGTTRFDNAVSEAKELLGLKNTIILAENTPVILLEEARSGEALDVLSRVSAKATSTNLGDAVLLAGDLLGKRKGVVTVVSDFIATEGSDLLMAKRSLTSKGNTVNFIDVSNKAENVGIIDLVVDKDETTVEIKNYDYQDRKVEVRLIQDGSRLSKGELKVAAFSKEKIILDTLPGVSKVELDVKDDLSVDNVAYISSPQQSVFKVLLITNFPKESKVRAALMALGVDLEVREPPTVNAYNIDHDIVFVSDVTKRLFVPTDFIDLKKYVDKGGIVVLGAQEDLGDIDTKGLLPLDITSKKDKATGVCVDIIGSIFPKDPFADEPCFTSVSKYLEGKAYNGTLALVSSQVDNSPMVLHMKQGLGEVVYYGIIDKYSGFYSDPFYPIFWNNIINYLMKTEDINEFNHKSGKVVILKDQEVKTPTFKVTTNKLVLDESGIYEFDNRKIAVNLLDEKESDVGKLNKEFKSEVNKFSAEKVKDIDHIELEVPLLIAVLVLLIFEFLYIKRRGDL